MKYFLPKQGEGPNQDMLDHGFLRLGFWGRGLNDAGEEVTVKGGISAKHGDPGYRYSNSISFSDVCFKNLYLIISTYFEIF
jgi:hypothetical protein